MDAARAAAIEVARAVELHPVGCALAGSDGIGPQLAVGQTAVASDLDYPDVLALGVVDEEVAFIGGKAQPVRLREVADQQFRRVRAAAQ